MTVLIGGARSGKSAAGRTAGLGGALPHHLLATGEPLDDEMAERIAGTVAERPSSWATVEEPLDLEAALGATADNGTVVVDCLTLWVANLIGTGPQQTRKSSRAPGKWPLCAGERPGKVIVVSNEVGAGIVPGDPLSRRYRDLLGHVNAVFAERAARRVPGGRRSGRTLVAGGAHVSGDHASGGGGPGFMSAASELPRRCCLSSPRSA